MRQTITFIARDEESIADPFADPEDDEEELETHEVIIKGKTD